MQPKPAKQAAYSHDPKDTEDIWYYDLQPLVANLDERGATRFVRVTLTLEFRSELLKKDGEALLKSKVPILTDWLNIYLGGLSINDCSGKNKKGIQAHICDGFNEKLFPDSKPMIQRILFKEFNIQ